MSPLFKFVRGTRRLTRSLRFRLAAGFLLFFSVVLLGLGLVVRQMLTNIVYAQVSALVDEEWAASKGYLRIVNQYPDWFYDRADPEEALIVNRITAGGPYLFADIHGNILERSSFVTSLGLDTTEEVVRRIEDARKRPQLWANESRRSQEGTLFLLRYGLLPDEKHRMYLLLIGRSLGDSTRVVDQFTTRYFTIMPLLILLCGALGWALAGKVLGPVTELAHTSQKISGSNLNVRIPLRNADDELDHLIASFNRMIGRLNQSFEQMRQFSTDVSHELRTPLTAIRGQLEVALFTAEKPEQFRDALANALQDVEQLSNIVKALLLLSRAESGQLVLQMSAVDLAHTTRDIAEQFQLLAEDAGLQFDFAASEPVFVQADKVQMERLVSNLISNAIKYTPLGGSIRIGVERIAGQGVLWVADTGIGIPEEKLPHIFDRFYRVRPSESNPVQGLGLGLSFVSWIVNAHKGKIEVQSKVGEGTRFTVRLPLAGDATQPSIPLENNLAGLPR